MEAHHIIQQKAALQAPMWRKPMSKEQKILVIEDDPDIITTVQMMLEPEGFEIIQAHTGSEGISRARLDRPDLILLDLMLERHDTGFTVAKTLKGDPVTRSIPIIMVSSVSERTGFSFDQQSDGHWMKTNDFLEKPYKREEILKKIREVLDAHNNTTE